MKSTWRLIATILVATTLSWTVPPAFGAAGVIEEIVVTARQRSESLQDAPVTITALSSDTIERLALNNLDQISDQVPNLLVSYGSSGGSATVTLRGIGTGSASAGFSSAVGLLIDDIHFERGRWVQGGMFDLAQVEVLKGPQALYFGKNNAAGLIILQTRDPGEEFEGHVKVGYEFDAQEVLTEAGVSIPLSDAFAIRLAGRYTEQNDGWMTNNAVEQVGVDPFGYVLPGAGSNKNLPALEEKLGRFTALWTPNEQFQAKFKASVTSTEDGGPIYHDSLSRCFGPGGRPQPVFGVPSPADDCKANFTRAKSNIPAGMMATEPSLFGDGTTFTEYDAYRVSLRMDYDFGAALVTSVTGFSHYDSDLVDNATFAGDAQVPFFERTDHDSFSQELRVQTQLDGTMNFLGGLLYTDKDLFFRNSARVAPLPPDSRNGRQWSWDKQADQESTAFSAYGELIWDVTETVELAGGARYTDEERDFLFTAPHVHEILLLLGALSDASHEGVFKDDDLSPQVTLTWRPTDAISFFGAYREGFKSGGFDASFILNPGAVIDDLRFESEEAEGFELGVKSRWLDDSLQVNATLYAFDYKNLQVSALDTETTTFRIQNAAEAYTEGFEVEVNWAPRPDLLVRGFINYNLAEYEEFLTNCHAGQSVEAGCDQGFNAASGRYVSQDIGGESVPVAPEWAATLGLTYDFDLAASGWRASLDLDGRYSGAYDTSLTQLPDTRHDSYAIFDASLRAVSPDERWEVSLTARNLFDKLVTISSSDRPLTGTGNGLPAGSPELQRADIVSRVLRGRQFWLQATYRL